jgi:hypothetical protein
MGADDAASELKGRGNDAFRAGRFAEAVKLYGEALALIDAACSKATTSGESISAKGLKELAVILHSNSAECSLRLDDWEAAHAAAMAALGLDPEHTKSKARAQRAQLALDMLASLQSQEPPVCSEPELRRAVIALQTLRNQGAPLHERALCTSVNGMQDDSLFDTMALLKPSVYDVMCEIVAEEVDELPARLRKQRKTHIPSIHMGCLTSALCSTNLRDRAETGPDPFSGLINAADGTRCIKLLKTGVWPKILQLQQVLFDELRRDDRLLDLHAKPLYRFINLLLAAPGCAEYILEHHCGSAAAVAPISRLMSLGETEVANQLEGLTNQAAAMLAVVAEDIGNTQYEDWLRQPLSEEQVMMYKMMAKPGARASLSRGRGLSHAEFSNQVRAEASMMNA